MVIIVNLRRVSPQPWSLPVTLKHEADHVRSLLPGIISCLDITAMFAASALQMLLGSKAERDKATDAQLSELLIPSSWGQCELNCTQDNIDCVPVPPGGELKACSRVRPLFSSTALSLTPRLIDQQPVPHRPLL